MAHLSYGPHHNRDESAYRQEVLVSLCCDNSLYHNINKTQGVIVDYRKQQEATTSPLFQVSAVLFTRSLWFELLAPSFLKGQKKFGIDPAILTNFIGRTIESILIGCVPGFGSSLLTNHKTLQRVVRTVDRWQGVPCHSRHLPHTSSVLKAQMITVVSCHPVHKLFTRLPSGRQYQYQSMNLQAGGQLYTLRS